MRCHDCGCEVLDYFGVRFTIDDTSVDLCSDCFNKRLEDIYGINISKVKKTSLLLKDQSGDEHFFRVKKIVTPTGYLLEAQEFVNDKLKGYTFDVHGDFECDQIKLEQELIKEVKKGLAYQSIEKDYMSEDTLKEKVFGRIEFDIACESRVPMMLIDGKEYTWEEFGEMLMVYEGWKFKLELE